MKRFTTMARQGDLLFIAIDRITGKLEKGRTVLVRGEVTGHAHQLAAPDAKVYVREDGTLEIEAESGTVHEEHAAIVPSRPQEIVLQWEYDPSEAARLRRVGD